MYYKKRSRVTGSYLINTNSKKQARAIFKKYISEGERVVEDIVTLQQRCDEYGETQEEFLGDIQIPEKDGFELIEAGT